MNKIFFYMIFAAGLMICLNSSVFAAQNEMEKELVLKGSVDLAGDIDTVPGKSFQSKNGFSLAFEGFYTIFPHIIKIGAGVEYMFPRLYEYEGSPRFSLLPTYIVVKIAPIKGAETIYIRAAFGVSFYFNDDHWNHFKYGNHYSVGIGFTTPYGRKDEGGALFEIVYSNSEGSYRDSTLQQDYDIRYSKLALYFGFRV